MKNINLGIEISEEVIKTEAPDKIERYDFVPQKDEEVIEMERIFSGCKLEEGKDLMGGKDNA